MPEPSNSDLMDRFGYTICASCNAEQLTFSMSPRGWCIGCEDQEARDARVA